MTCFGVQRLNESKIAAEGEGYGDDLVGYGYSSGRETERRVLEELSRMRNGLRRDLRLRELQQAYARARSHMPSVEAPSRLRLMLESTASLQASRLSGSRRELAQWTDIRRRLREGRIR